MPGVVLIAPRRQHMEVHSRRILLTDAPTENSCRTSVDVLFRSLARTGAVSKIAAILLTGMGSDGPNGLLALKTAGA